MIEEEFEPAIAHSAQELAETNDALIIALPATGHKNVMDALAPHIREGQHVIISSHASFGAVYLTQALAARGVTAPVTAWGTTIVSGRRQEETKVRVNTIRNRVDLCTVPEAGTDDGLALCQSLFGDRFMPRDGLLAILLSNLNPQNHLGIALCNITRMERGEDWSQGLNVTPKVGRLLEKLDLERLADRQGAGPEGENDLRTLPPEFPRANRNYFRNEPADAHAWLWRPRTCNGGQPLRDRGCSLRTSGHRSSGPAGGKACHVT